MNKYKKIASAVVSIVLAGTMVGSMAACDNGGGSNSGAKLQVNLDEAGKLTYAEGTSLTLNIGYQSTSTPAYTSFQSGKDISGKTYLIDGQSYSSGDLKPAWKAVATNLGLTLKDNFQNVSSDKQIDEPISSRTLGQYDIISGSLAAINQNSGNNNFLNFNDYLQYMPNYSKFLEENPVTVYSLTGEATGKNAGSMYAAPYLDGNKDIENYVLIRKDWVRTLLDTETLSASKFVSFAAQAKSKDSYKSGSSTEEYGSIIGTKSSITSYMGKTSADNYDIDVVNATTGEKETITVDYGKALTAATTPGTPLNSALTAVEGVDDNAINTLTSGNIVDLQNLAINKSNGLVTGDQLAKIVREYIFVAYVKDGTPYYTTPSDVFNSVSAAWDVDLLAATLRIIVTVKPDSSYNGLFYEVVGGDIWGIVARQNITQRRVNLYSLAAQLYGVRGMESRLEYLYIDNAGNLKDARQDEESYDLLNNFSAFAKEGILYTGSKGEDGKNSYYSTGNDAVLGAMSYDYVQTQTRYQMLGDTPEGYDYAPIVTPVSKWDVDGDGNHTDIMRFTESWRSVKNTGFCVPTAAVSGNPDKLSAVLTLIDYIFSEDGQILLTYGTPSSSDSYVPGSTAKVPGTSSDNGWWYAEESDLALATVADVKVPGYGKIKDQYEVKKDYKDQVFVYEGKVYQGEPYGGKVVPKITKANRAFFEGKSITVAAKDGGAGGTVQQASGNIVINQKGNYSDYARLIMGTTMPVGSKNQGFEYQFTADCGRAGADIVDDAIQAGVIKHVVTDPDKVESPWYFISPTVFPLTAGNRGTLNNSAQTLISGTYFVNNTDATLNVYVDIILYGLGSTTFLGSPTYIAGRTDVGTLKSSGAEYISFLNSGSLSGALTARVNIYKLAWNNLKSYYKINFS